MLLFTSVSTNLEDVKIGEDEIRHVTDDILKKRLDKINQLLQKTSEVDVDETTFQTVHVKGDMLEAAMKRADEQREKDENRKALEKEKEMIQIERQKRKNNSHYGQGWDNNFK